MSLDRTRTGRRTGNGQVGNHTHHHSFIATRYGAEWPPKSGSPLFIATFAACIDSHFASSGTRFVSSSVILSQGEIFDFRLNGLVEWLPHCPRDGADSMEFHGNIFETFKWKDRIV